MRWILVLLIGVIALSDIMSWPLSLGPGLSVKNAVLYAGMFALTFRAVLRGVRGIELPALHMIFGFWVFYAMVTWVLAAKFIKYPHYELIANAITLKADLIDSVLFFLLAFHVLSTKEDVVLGFKAVAAAIGIASLATLLDVAHITHLGINMGSRGAEEGRVFGVFGHANDTAALIDFLLPISVAVALSGKGFQRLIWIGGAFASLAVLLLTVSRGAYVGAVVGGLWAAYLCRRMIPLQKILAWGFVGIAVILAAVTVLGLAIPDIGHLITGRLTGGGISADEMSSGRTVLWMEVIGRMMDKPITLLTGYGWDVYWVMPFRYATHNYYLNLWFNLGLVGVGSFVAALVVGVHNARHAAEEGLKELQNYNVAFVFGLLMLTVAVFFGNIGGHWQFVWIYYGIGLRAAVIALESPEPTAVALPEPATRRDPFAIPSARGFAHSGAPPAAPRGAL